MTDLDMSKEILKTKDLQTILGVGRDTAYALMQSESFPSLRLGKRFFVKRSDFEAWFDENKNGTFLI